MVNKNFPVGYAAFFVALYQFCNYVAKVRIFPESNKPSDFSIAIPVIRTFAVEFL
jgi:hypothetical protein